MLWVCDLRQKSMQITLFFFMTSIKKKSARDLQPKKKGTRDLQLTSFHTRPTPKTSRCCHHSCSSHSCASLFVGIRQKLFAFSWPRIWILCLNTSGFAADNSRSNCRMGMDREGNVLMSVGTPEEGKSVKTVTFNATEKCPKCCYTMNGTSSPSSAAAPARSQAHHQPPDEAPHPDACPHINQSLPQRP